MSGGYTEIPPVGSGSGSVTSVDVSGGTTGLTATGGPVTTSGTITLGGVLAVADGGTGQVTANAALNALLPSQATHSGQILSTNGTNSSWAAAGSGTVTSVAATGGTTGLSFSGSPITTSGTLTLSGVLAIANGGSGQSNQQAGINNLTDIVSHSNGDVFQLLGGNAQFAPFTAPPPVGTALTFAGFDSLGALGSIPNWTFQNTPLDGASNADLTYNPNNLAVNVVAANFSVNVTPLQSSPDDSLNVMTVSSNLDAASNGFDFGSNGRSVTLYVGSFNDGGNASTYGRLTYASYSGSIGNATDPVTINGIDFVEGFFNLNANATIDGSLQGYGFQPSLDVASITTSNFSVSAFYDLATFPVAVYGYNAFITNPNIASIANNHNFTGFNVGPNITTMAGNAGFTAFGCFAQITTSGTGGFNGLNINPTITTQVSNSSFSGVYVGGTLPTMGAAGSSYQGCNVNPNITTSHGSILAYQAGPQVAGGDADVNLYSGNMGQVTTSGGVSVLNLDGLTANGRQSSFSAGNVNMNIGGTLTAASAQGIQSQHVIFTSYVTPNGTAITGTDILCNIFSPDVDFGDAGSSVAIGPSGLGVSMVAFAGQMHGHGQMDLMSSLIAGAIFAEDFTLVDYRNVNAVMINAGYTGVCTNATAFYHEITGAGPFATNHWGLKVVSDVDNFVTKMAINTANKKAASPFVLDIVGETQNQQTATDVGVYGHYVNLTSNTTANGSNELFAFFSENVISVDATFTNAKALVGSSQTLTRGTGADDGTLDGLVGHESFLKISSGAAGVTTDSFGFLSLVQAVSGTATNFYHFRSVSIEAGGAITNQFGIYLPHDSTTPLKNWLSGTSTLGGTSFVASNANTVATINEGHIGSIQATPPSVAVQAGAGTGAAAVLTNATDIAGNIELDLGTLTLAGGAQAIITFDKTYAVAPIVLLTPTNATAAVNSAAFGVYTSSSTSTFTINFATAGIALSTLKWNYMVIETE